MSIVDAFIGKSFEVKSATWWGSCTPLISAPVSFAC